MSEAVTESLQNEDQPERELLVVEVKDRHWRDKANCLDIDPDEFFIHTTWRNPDPTDLRGRYCDGCPVKSDCLATDILFGVSNANVQGGLLEDERRSLRRRYVKQQTELKKATRKEKRSSESSDAGAQLPQQRQASRRIYEPDDREINHMRRTINCGRPVREVPLASVHAPTPITSPTQNRLKKPQLGAEAAQLLMAQGSLRARLVANTKLLQSLSELSMITDDIDQDQIRQLRDDNVILELQLDNNTMDQECLFFDRASDETVVEAS